MTAARDEPVEYTDGWRKNRRVLLSGWFDVDAAVMAILDALGVPGAPEVSAPKPAPQDAAGGRRPTEQKTAAATKADPTAEGVVSGADLALCGIIDGRVPPQSDDAAWVRVSQVTISNIEGLMNRGRVEAATRLVGVYWRCWGGAEPGEVVRHPLVVDRRTGRYRKVTADDIRDFETAVGRHRTLLERVKHALAVEEFKS